MNSHSLPLLKFVLVSVLACPTIGQEKLIGTKIDPAGVWRWTHEENGETVKDVLTLNFDGKQVSGKYKGRVEKTIEQARLDNDKLTFQFDVEYQGEKIIIKFDGTLKEDILEGKVLIEAGGNTQEFPWNAKRTLEDDDVLGTWKILIKTEDGQVYEPELKLTKKDGKITGAYISKEVNQNLEAKNIKVLNGQLSFDVSGEHEGTRFIVKYNGRPRGDKLTGKVDYDLGGDTGSLDFIATRN